MSESSSRQTKMILTRLIQSIFMALHFARRARCRTCGYNCQSYVLSKRPNPEFTPDIE